MSCNPQVNKDRLTSYNYNRQMVIVSILHTNEHFLGNSICCIEFMFHLPIILLFQDSIIPTRAFQTIFYNNEQHGILSYSNKLPT